MKLSQKALVTYMDYRDGRIAGPMIQTVECNVPIVNEASLDELKSMLAGDHEPRLITILGWSRFEPADAEIIR